MSNVTLTQEQAQLVMQCLDHAVKAGGLNAASQILPLAVEIQKQLATSDKPAED